MTHQSPTHRRYARRSRRTRVSTETDEHSTVRLAQILTSAALQKALRETEARAEHTSRAAEPGDLPSAENLASGVDEGAHHA